METSYVSVSWFSAVEKKEDGDAPAISDRRFNR